MSDKRDGIARGFGGLGFYRGCSITFGPLDKTSNNNNTSSLSSSPANFRDTISPVKPTHQVTSNHLLELQKEIKEEEDEIFADINSLLNSRSNLYFPFGDDEDDGVHLDDNENNSSIDDGQTKLHIGSYLANIGSHLTNGISNNNNNNNMNNNNNTNRNNSSHRHQSNYIHHHQPNHATILHNFANHDHNSDEHLLTNDSDDLNDYQSHSAGEITTLDYQNDSLRGGQSNPDDITYSDPFHMVISKAIHVSEQTINFSSLSNHHPHQYNTSSLDTDEKDELIEQANYEIDPDYITEQGFTGDCHSLDQQNYQDIQAVIQQVQSNLPKPCVFFLEGNCRRSDCKYSHDLSNITCKYWIEGFCFKGEMCPFLHSYNPQSDSSLSDNEGMKLLPKKELNPTFAIESEADFPSLPLDGPAPGFNDSAKNIINPEALATDLKHQILTSNPAVVFKTVKKKRKRG